MAVSWRREHRPNLETIPWKVLSLETTPGESKEYLVKGLFEEEGYHMMVSDSSAMWEENLDSRKILDRLKVTYHVDILELKKIVMCVSEGVV